MSLTETPTTPAVGSQKPGIFGWLVGVGAFLLLTSEFLKDTAPPKHHGGLGAFRPRRSRRRRAQ